MTPRRRRQLIAAIVCAIVLVAPTVVAWLRAWTSADDTFVSLPPSGPGWRSSSTIVGAMGRQYLRKDVLASLTAALTSAAADEGNGRVFVVADSGDSDGGPFPPHATHKDGRSVDILLPLRDSRARPATLTTSVWNLWGYCWHLDGDGRVRGLKWEAKPIDLPVLGKTRLCPDVAVDSDDAVDFEATAKLLQAIAREASTRGLRIATIIIAPEYVDKVTSTPTGLRLGALERRFVRHAVWVRHDEHVHVDFAPR